MENLLNNEPVKRVKNFITKFDPNLKILILNTTARTAKDASEALKCDVGAIIKSLLLKVDNDFLICLVAGDKRCSIQKIKNFLNKKNVSMASAVEVKANTGFSIGGVSPVAHIKKLNIFIDSSLSRFTDIFAAAGHPNCVFKIKYNLLIKITKALEIELTE